ncbi:hypothetical protein C2845_PM18G00210 [Panicum miliaceum]|uniref:Uncharacterized protein n=1 Tax=Panicum miliaceum TaxID=4540 RepID=A0A3L6PGI7_PANMI|nr:hypothetical protein C2845_PM18G00210 [Panicum miliaceum]
MATRARWRQLQFASRSLGGLVRLVNKASASACASSWSSHGRVTASSVRGHRRSGRDGDGAAVWIGSGGG